jgi:hypothetical protein
MHHRKGIQISCYVRVMSPRLRLQNISYSVSRPQIYLDVMRNRNALSLPPPKAPLRSLTERHGGVVSTAASYSRGPGFKYRPGDRLSSLRPFVVFLNPSKQKLG